MKATFCNCT